MARIASACGRLATARCRHGRPFRAPAPHDQRRRADRRRHPAAAGRDRPWPTAASSSSTSSASSAATRSRRCGRRWRPARCRSPVRAAGARLPCRFMLVAAANPCPCGRGEDDPECSCAPVADPALPGAAQRRARRSHRHPRRGAPAERRRRSAVRPGEPSAAVRERVGGGARAPGAAARPGSLQRRDDARPRRASARSAPRPARCWPSSTRASGSAGAPTTGRCGWRGRSPTSPGPRRSAPSRWRRPCNCGGGTVAEPRACPDCLRRSWLLAALGPYVEKIADRRGRLALAGTAAARQRGPGRRRGAEGRDADAGAGRGAAGAAPRRRSWRRPSAGRAVATAISIRRACATPPMRPGR